MMHTQLVFGTLLHFLSIASWHACFHFSIPCMVLVIQALLATLFAEVDTSTRQSTLATHAHSVSWKALSLPPRKIPSLHNDSVPPGLLAILQCMHVSATCMQLCMTPLFSLGPSSRLKSKSIFMRKENNFCSLYAAHLILDML